MALGAIDALRYDLRLAVPDQVMVAGFDDIPEAARPPYDLTTLRQPRDEMVRETLELLGLGKGSTPDAAQARVIPGSLIERGTLRPKLSKPSTGDPGGG